MASSPAGSDDALNALRRPCIADNSVLSNFVHAGVAGLLHALVEGPLYLPPSILDPDEANLPTSAWQDHEATSELLRPLHTALRLGQEAAATPGKDVPDLPLYRRTKHEIEAFRAARGTLWNPLELTPGELALAQEFTSRDIRNRVREHCPNLRGRRQLQVGEAEVAAIAVTRGWTVLVDDQAAVELLRCLYPTVRFFRTCELLVIAAQAGYVVCEEAARLFNDVMVAELGFFAVVKGRRLHFRCDPARCGLE